MEGTLVIPMWKFSYFWVLLCNDGRHWNSFVHRQQAVPAAMFVVYACACVGLVLCYGRPIFVRAVLKLLQFTSLWRSRLLTLAWWQRHLIYAPES